MGGPGDAPAGLEVHDPHDVVLLIAVQAVLRGLAEVLEPVDAPRNRHGQDPRSGGGHPFLHPAAHLWAEHLQRNVEVGSDGLLDVGANAQGVAVFQVGVEALDHGAGAVGGQAALPGVGVAEVAQALFEELPQGGTAQVLPLRLFCDGMNEAAQGLGVTGRGRATVA